MINTPDTASPDYTAQAVRWDLITALRSGTYGMRVAGSRFLPKHPKEGEGDYRVRLQNSVLSPFLDDTISTLVGRAFAQEWQHINTSIPQEWTDDIDLQGNNLNQFARIALDDSLSYGKTHVLADAPPRIGNATLADDRRAKRRPYFTHIPARNVIAWKYRTQNGKDVLTHVRYREWVDVEVDRWTTKRVERIRVLEPGIFEIWEGSDRVDQGITGLDHIPLTTHYSRKTGFMTALPLFENLAYLNQRHWISTSDQNHILRICRVPIIATTGLTETDEIVISPNSHVRLPIGSDMKYIVMDSGGIESGWRDLERLEIQCRVLGMMPLLEVSGSNRTTATEASIDNTNTHTTLRSLVLSFKDRMELALEDMAQLGGFQRTAGGSLLPNLDFGIKGDPLEMQNLILLYQQGLMTGVTLLQEAKRRGLLSSTVDPQVEFDLAKIAAPTLTSTAEPLNLDIV